MLRFTERQGFHSRTLLTLATVGIMSVFLLGHSQTASADQTYVSDSTQALTFAELEAGTNPSTSTQTQAAIASEAPATVTTISHTSVDDQHTHENDFNQSTSTTPTFDELAQNSQTASSTVNRQTGVITYETKIPTSSESHSQSQENKATSKTETVAQAQTWSKDGATWVSTTIDNGNVHKILSTYFPKPLTDTTKPATTGTSKPKTSSSTANQPKKPATVANKPSTTATIQPKKPVTNENKPTASGQATKPVDRVAQVWQKNNVLVKENYNTPHWSSNEATIFIKAKTPEIVTAYKEAITSWNNTGAFNFLLTDDKLKANIIADERYEENVASPLGVTYSTYYVPTKQYNNATVYLNSFHVKNNYYQKNGGKLLNTAQHELGHAIGLDHNSAVASVMEPKGGKTSIQPIDINNVKKLYGKIV